VNLELFTKVKRAVEQTHVRTLLVHEAPGENPSFFGETRCREDLYSLYMGLTEAYGKHLYVQTGGKCLLPGYKVIYDGGKWYVE